VEIIIKSSLPTKVQIDCQLGYAHIRSSVQDSSRPLRDPQSIAIYSRFIDCCMWHNGTIYGWQSTNLSQSWPPIGIAGANTNWDPSQLESLVEGLIESLIESLLESLLKSLFESWLQRLLQSHDGDSQAAVEEAFPEESSGRLNSEFVEALATGWYNSVDTLTLTLM